MPQEGVPMQHYKSTNLPSTHHELFVVNLESLPDRIHGDDEYINSDDDEDFDFRNEDVEENLLVSHDLNKRKVGDSIVYDTV